MERRLIVGDDVWAVSSEGFAMLRDFLAEGAGKAGALIALAYLVSRGHARKLIVWETSEYIH